MSGPYGPNDTPGSGEGHSSDPTQQWSGPQATGAEPTQQWGGQQPWSQQPWAPQQGVGSADPTQQWGGQPPQWGQQSSPSWPAQQPAQPSAWEPTAQQWGQPPQQPQQWNQSDQWAQQGPSQPSPPVKSGKKSRRGLLFGGIGLLVVVVVAVVLAFVFLGSNKLDNAAVQTGVQKVLKDSYGIDDVQDVNCPSGKKVAVGNTFTCTLKVGGEQKNVTVKVTKSDGTYEVGRPN